MVLEEEYLSKAGEPTQDASAENDPIEVDLGVAAESPDGVVGSKQTPQRHFGA